MLGLYLKFILFYSWVQLTKSLQNYKGKRSSLKKKSFDSLKNMVFDIMNKYIMVNAKMYTQWQVRITNLEDRASQVMCNTETGATSGAGTAYPSGAPEFTPCFQWGSCLQFYLCVCFVDRCLSFCPFSFGHCVVCPSSIYGF